MPNFLVIAAQKSGTSTLCDLLARHQDVFMTDPKEPHFFCKDENFAKGVGWYARLFEGAKGHRAIGEGSTSYTMRHLRPHAAERIAEHLPEARLLYLVRHPMDRIVSHWIHVRSRGQRESRPLDVAIREDPVYLDTSRYLMQIDTHRAWCPDERILVLFLEDLVSDRAGTLRRCFEFLGVDPAVAQSLELKRLNASAGSREDTPILTRLRNAPGFEALRDAMPDWLRSRLRLTLKRPTPRPAWSHEAWAWAAERLEEESRAFLRRYGKPEDHWSFEYPGDASAHASAAAEGAADANA